MFEVKYPFALDKYPSYSDTPAQEVWIPGFKVSEDETENGNILYAHDHGKAIYTVVSIHRPGKYPIRVLYTRHWVDPTGTAIKGKGLRCLSIAKFKRDSTKYAYDDRVEIVDYEDMK
ncbi:MAG: hypothetical protein COB78_09855 [Hyphomicrobiales bacterium]|nr:MAG: hypothetical protein COB78_09855 [Hyphomicrobiales bacterium]